MEKIIEAENLKKYFGKVKAVDGISLSVEKGELFGFLGVNGAGKSTTINMLCTLFVPTDGKARICGFDLQKDSAQIKRKIGIVYQNNCLDERLTVKENLMVWSSLYGQTSREQKTRLIEICDILELNDILGRRFGKLSGGQKRRCEIAKALMHRPEILFLDEPTTGLDPATRKSVWETVEKLRREMGMTVFLTTHYMEEAARATTIAIIDGGRLKEMGTPFTLKERYASDKLNLVPKAGKEEALSSYLADKKITYKMKEERLVIRLENSMEAFDLLDDIRADIEGFEVIQGTMDDVFLQVTGKSAVEGL
ncbi:MAG: ABC transporter ATP-binding protein [Lachnospiraceae bacterium]|nr:ABC transporter ATP-binding protein [Lachnospiraceae bacterium]